MNKKIFALVVACALMLSSLLLVRVDAGYVTGSASAAGCAGLAVACYSGAGYVFGTVLSAFAPTPILNCNAAFGKCMETTAAVYSSYLP